MIRLALRKQIKNIFMLNGILNFIYFVFHNKPFLMFRSVAIMFLGANIAAICIGGHRCEIHQGFAIVRTTNARIASPSAETGRTGGRSNGKRVCRTTAPRHAQYTKVRNRQRSAA